MRFYTSNANGTSDEDLNLTLKPDQSATFAGEISQIYNSGNTGAFQYLKNPNSGNAAYVSKKWQNDDSGFGEIWRNSSTRNAGAGNTVSSFNMYNSAAINFWPGGSLGLTLDASQNATFTGLVSGITPTAAANFTTKNYVDTTTAGYRNLTFVDGTEKTDRSNGVPAPSRTSNPDPQDYDRVFSTEFKNSASIGSPVGNAWAGLISMAPYNVGSSGFKTTQLAFAASGSNTDLYIRQGAATTWGNWSKILTETNSGTGPFLPLAGGTMTGNLRLNDSVNLFLGAQTDFVLAHNGSNSYISNYTGDLYIEQAKDDGDIIFKCDNGSGGTTEYFRLDGGAAETIFSRNTQHLDSVYAQFGTGKDLQIYHESSNISYIKHNASSDFRIQTSSTGYIKLMAELENMAVFIPNSAVELYFDNSKKLQTTNTGVTITGAATATTFLGDLNGTINTATTGVTQVNSVDNTTIATTAYVNNKIALIPAGLVFQGTWDARTAAEGGAAGNKGNPALTSGVGTTGNFYIVSNAGSVNLDGITDWKTGDWAVFIEQGASDQWEKIDNSFCIRWNWYRTNITFMVRIWNIKYINGFFSITA